MVDPSVIRMPHKFFVRMPEIKASLQPRWISTTWRQLTVHPRWRFTHEKSCCSTNMVNSLQVDLLMAGNTRVDQMLRKIMDRSNLAALRDTKSSSRNPIFANSKRNHICREGTLWPLLACICFRTDVAISSSSKRLFCTTTQQLSGPTLMSALTVTMKYWQASTLIQMGSSHQST